MQSISLNFDLEGFVFLTYFRTVFLNRWVAQNISKELCYTQKFVQIFRNIT
jgi:hypothetical protein